MADFALKYSEIIKTEENEAENKKKLLEISEKIYNLKKKTQENEIEVVANEKKSTSLIEASFSLEIDFQLLKNQNENLKSKIQQQSKVLEVETNNLEKTQQDVWEKMEEFIVKTRNCKKQSEISKVKDLIKIRDNLKKQREIEKGSLKLKGEAYGLNLYKEFQQKQIKLVEQAFLSLKESGVIKIADS